MGEGAFLIGGGRRGGGRGGGKIVCPVCNY